jgi:hypothetical protein
MAQHRVIVVGGGLAGLAACVRIAEAGMDVDLFSLVPVKRIAQRLRPGRHQRLQRGRTPAGLLGVRALRRDHLRRGLPRRSAPRCSRWPTGPPRSSTCSTAWASPSTAPPRATRPAPLRRLLFKRTHFAGATTGQQLLYAFDEQTRRYESEGQGHQVRVLGVPLGRCCMMAAASASWRRTCGPCRSARSAPTPSSWPPEARAGLRQEHKLDHLHGRRGQLAAIRPAPGTATPR